MPRPTKKPTLKEKLEEMARLYHEDLIPEQNREILREFLEAFAEQPKPN